MIDGKKIIRTIIGLFFILSVPLIIFGFVMSQISAIDKTTGIWIFLGWTIFLLIGLFILPIRYTRNELENPEKNEIDRFLNLKKKKVRALIFTCQRCRKLFLNPQSYGGHLKWCKKKQRKNR